MKHAISPFLFVLILLGCSKDDPSPEFDSYPEVSLIRLIANPDDYQGRKVLTSGYLHLEFEGNSLYLDETHARVGLYRNAIWFNYPEDIASQIQPFSDKYVSIYGKFSHDSRGDGHMGLWSGTIEISSTNEVWMTDQRLRASAQ